MTAVDATGDDSTAASGEPDLDEGQPVRVLISYAHDDAQHQENVRGLWTFLRSRGIDARLDTLAENEQQSWPRWMDGEIRAAQFVLAVASPKYRERTEGRSPAETGEREGRGARYEGWRLQDLFYRQGEPGIAEVVAVVLPGGSRDGLPDWLMPDARTVYTVREYTVEGAEKLIRLLTEQPAEQEPPLGRVPRLAPRPLATLPSATAPSGLQRRAPLRTEVRIEATLEDGELACAVSVAGTELSSTRRALPHEVARAWTGRCGAIGRRRPDDRRWRSAGRGGVR